MSKDLQVIAGLVMTGLVILSHGHPLVRTIYLHVWFSCTSFSTRLYEKCSEDWSWGLLCRDETLESIFNTTRRHNPV